ncbi:hypothetical protein LCGC14_1648260, partial [marine sediment metagenome]
MEWFKEKGDISTASSIHALVLRLEGEQITQRGADNFYFDIYSGKMKIQSNVAYQGHLLKLNVFKAVTDSITAKITRDRPNVRLKTTRGNWELKSLAKNLSQFLNEELEDFKKEADVYTSSACIFGTSIAYVVPTENGVCIERVPKREIFIDNVEAIYGKPGQLHRRR